MQEKGKEVGGRGTPSMCHRVTLPSCPTLTLPRDDDTCKTDTVGTGEKTQGMTFKSTLQWSGESLQTVTSAVTLIRSIIG